MDTSRHSALKRAPASDPLVEGQAKRSKLEEAPPVREDGASGGAPSDATSGLEPEPSPYAGRMGHGMGLVRAAIPEAEQRDAVVVVAAGDVTEDPPPLGSSDNPIVISDDDEEGEAYSLRTGSSAGAGATALAGAGTTAFAAAGAHARVPNGASSSFSVAAARSSSSAAGASTTSSSTRPRYDHIGGPNTMPFAVAGETQYAEAQMVYETEMTLLQQSLSSSSAMSASRAAQFAKLRQGVFDKKLGDVSRYLNSADRQNIQLLSGSLDLGTPGEYTTGSLTKLYLRMRDETVITRDSVLCDVGSGIGRPVFAAVLTGTFQQAVGIEIVPQQVEQCRAMAACYGIPRVEFLHVDASKVRPPFDATHLYVFSQGFDVKLLQAFAGQLNGHRKWRYLATATPPERWRAAGLRFGHAPVETVTGMKMVGSGRAYCMYIVWR